MTRLRKHKTTHQSAPYFKKGLTLPGYNYLGPFNSLNNGPPTNPSDAAARLHDVMYKRYQRSGGNPYITYIDADDEFLSSVQSDFGGKVGSWFFNAKKRLAEKGWIKDDRTSSKKALTQTPVLRVGQSLSNFQRNAQVGNMVDGAGSGLEAGLKETPLDEVTQVHRGPPNYTFASLPAIYEAQVSGTMHSYDLAYRMTSGYDPVVSIASSDANAGAGTMTVNTPQTAEPDASAAKVRWWDYYSGLYNYYHVVGCKWRFTFENTSNDTVWVHQMYYSDNLPPVGATNLDMLMWSDCNSYFVGTHGAAIMSTGFLEHNEMTANVANDEDRVPGTTVNYETGNHVSRRGASPIVQISGQYTPGDFRREIRQDSDVENWTLCTTNPTFPERLLFRIKNRNEGTGDNDANSYDRPFDFNYRIELEYLIEFKELKDGLRWPVSKQPITVTISQDVN